MVFEEGNNTYATGTPGIAGTSNLSFLSAKILCFDSHTVISNPMISISSIYFYITDLSIKIYLAENCHACRDINSFQCNFY